MTRHSGGLPSAEAFARAAERGLVTYFVQPIWNVPEGRAAGVELLVRMRGADGFGPVPPDVIAAAARGPGSGLGPAASLASGAARAILDGSRDLFASVNVTDGFLERDAAEGTDWLDRLTRGLRPERLVFEIVETAEIKAPGRTTRFLEALRRRGHRIALDDFGAGRSDLARLEALPLDIVKLDRRLVGTALSDPAALAQVRAVGALAAERGIDVIAEGIETERQRDAMLAEGIVLQQGFLLGRPAPVEHWAGRIAG